MFLHFGKKRPFTCSLFGKVSFGNWSECLVTDSGKTLHNAAALSRLLLICKKKIVIGKDTKGRKYTVQVLFIYTFGELDQLIVVITVCVIGENFQETYIFPA